MLELNKIHNTDALSGLKSLPNESIDMIITSPPYWNQRDYGHRNQIGMEDSLQDYIDNLIYIFHIAKRVLKKEGTCWINLGDTYSRNKSLSLIPERFAIEMTKDWILRNTIIWYKPNAMPHSVKDRFTVDFEKLFFFVKNKQYYFNQQLEPLKVNSDIQYRQALRKKNAKRYNLKEPYKTNYPKKFNPNGRNTRAVWSIPLRPFIHAHFAVYPKELLYTPIKSGCPKGGIVLDPFMGSGTTAAAARELGRNFLGFEINPEYIKIANSREVLKNGSLEVFL